MAAPSASPLTRYHSQQKKHGTISTLGGQATNALREIAPCSLVNELLPYSPNTPSADLDTAPEEVADNLLTTANARIHSRQRGLLGNAFTESALKASHPLIQGYCDLLIQKFEEMVLQGRERRALVDMTDWMTFFTMDVIGDLSFGEPFGCLEKGQYHDWVRKLFQYVKAITVVAAPRYYSVRVTDFILRNLLPRSVTEGQKAHKRYADDRINRRLDKLEAKTDCSRPDFMTPFMANNAKYEIMSRDEITSTFNFIILGGSETTSTPLTGLFNHLSRQPAILARVTKEIRDHFQSEKDIVLEALPGGDILPYLEAVINEALRMCNPIPAGLPRQVPEGGDTYSGVFLPGGVSLTTILVFCFFALIFYFLIFFFILCIFDPITQKANPYSPARHQTRMRVQTYSISRSATYFHRPDSFCPERWLPKGSGGGEFDGDNLAASKPFGTGFSACLGWRMALGQMRLVVSRVLWRFDVAEDKAEPVDFDDWALPSFVEKGPMRIWLRLREGF